MPKTTSAEKFDLYQRLQRYVGWTDADAENVKFAGDIIRPSFEALIDDFYMSIQIEPNTSRMITGGPPQIERLKSLLLKWLHELFSGVYDEEYVIRRWQVGFRHVQIGLRQVFADAALARLRAGLQEALELGWPRNRVYEARVARSVNRLLDLELAIIQDAYTHARVVVEKHNVKQQSEATFRRLVEAARCIIMILKDNEKIAYFSPFAEQLTGYAMGDVVDRDYCEQFISPVDRKQVAQNLKSIMTSGAPTSGLLFPILCRNGEQRSIMWNGQCLDDYDGGRAVMIVGHDITELKQAQEKVLQSERLAAIGQTVTGLAHESRNAFQRSQACLEMLEVELEGRPEELELVQRIQRALDHLHHLYEEVRDYAAPRKLDRHMCNLAHLWREVWGQLEVTRREKPAELYDENVSGEVWANVDRFQLGQVFRNILENALVAAESPGKIAISIHETDLQEQPAWQLVFSDNGPGIPVENRKRIFDPFFTTKAKGTGLGMAIARRIIEAHGGTIDLGGCQQGAEFIVTLPKQ